MFFFLLKKENNLLILAFNSTFVPVFQYLLEIWLIAFSHLLVTKNVWFSALQKVYQLI